MTDWVNGIPGNEPKSPPLPIYKRPGTANVFIRHEPGFLGFLRPCYDSAADCQGLMTSQQVSTLRSMIARYVSKCHEKNSV